MVDITITLRIGVKIDEITMTPKVTSVIFYRLILAERYWWLLCACINANINST